MFRRESNIKEPVSQKCKMSIDATLKHLKIVVDMKPETERSRCVREETIRQGLRLHIFISTVK